MRELHQGHGCLCFCGLAWGGRKSGKAARLSLVQTSLTTQHDFAPEAERREGGQEHYTGPAPTSVQTPVALQVQTIAAHGASDTAVAPAVQSAVAIGAGFFTVAAGFVDVAPGVQTPVAPKAGIPAVTPSVASEASVPAVATAVQTPVAPVGAGVCHKDTAPAEASGECEDEADVPTELPADLEAERCARPPLETHLSPAPSHVPLPVPIHVSVPVPLPVSQYVPGKIDAPHQRRTHPMRLVPSCPWPFLIGIRLHRVGYSDLGRIIPGLTTMNSMPDASRNSYSDCMDRLQGQVNDRSAYTVIIDSRALHSEATDLFIPAPEILSHSGSHPDFVQALSRVTPLMHRVLHRLNQQMLEILNVYPTTLFSLPLPLIQVVIFDDDKGTKWAGAVQIMLMHLFNKQAYTVQLATAVHNKCSCPQCQTPAMERQNVHDMLRAMSEGYNSAPGPGFAGHP